MCAVAINPSERIFSIPKNFVNVQIKFFNVSIKCLNH